MRSQTVGVYNACLKYCVKWEECKGLPRIATWKTTEKNLILYFDDEPKKVIPLTKVIETVNK